MGKNNYFFFAPLDIEIVCQFRSENRTPAKVGRRRRGWCGCLTGPDDPPEITYCVADNGGGGLTLQALTPTQPMPDEEELNAKFAELVVSIHFMAKVNLNCTKSIIAEMLLFQMSMCNEMHLPAFGAIMS